MNKSVLSFSLIILNSFMISAQQSPQKAKNSPEIEVVKSINTDDYTDWKKVENKFFSFYIPKDLEQKKQKCIDSAFCDDFESDRLNLGIDINVDAGFPTFEKRFSTYSEKFFWIDEAFAWNWSYEKEKEEEGKYNYFSGVLFQFDKYKNYRIGMYLHSKDTNIKEMGEKIFKSVKFIYKPSVKN